MIRLRLGAFGNDKGDLFIPIEEGDSLKIAASKILVRAGVTYIEEEKVFHANVNGHNIPTELWAYSQLKPTDSVVLYPKLGDANSASSLGRLAVIMLSVGLLGGAGGLLTNALGITATNAIGIGLVNMGITVVASALTMGMAPPPVLPNDVSTDSSQMYSITAQGNSAKKYGKVPKVYGTHKIFPTVAANPYTDLVADPATGVISQYLTAVYDFGLGSGLVSDIRIGDTLLSNFEDYQMRLVDFNKPVADEGEWDKQLHSELAFYKGDVETEQFSIALNGNRDSGSQASEYEIIRTAAANPDADRHEIQVNFLNPNGLVSFSPAGDRGTADIELEVQFAPTGTNSWVNFNDPQYVEAHSSIGGFDAYQESVQTIYLGTLASTNPYPLLYTKQETYGTWEQSDWGPYYNRKDANYYGLPKGSSYVHLPTSPSVAAGREVVVNGKSIGKILSLTPLYGGQWALLDTPLSLDIPIRKEIAGAVAPESVAPIISTRLVSPGKFKISRKETGQVLSTLKFTPYGTGTYDVRIIRANTTAQFSSNIQSDLYLSSISTRFDRTPIVTDKRHIFLELRIKATNQLNGSIQNLSGVYSSVIDTYDGANWVKQATSNPAWIFADILTGEVNKRPVPKSRLHLPSLIEWADFCDEIPTSPTGRTYTFPRFTCNFILDYDATVQSVINQVAGASQASMNIVDGKYGVLIDRLKTVPAQIFTTRNSRDFSCTKAFNSKPHALKIKYISDYKGWESDDLVVYDSGYTIANATDIEEAQSFGVTNTDQAYRFGRFLLFQNRLRQEVIGLTVDFEHLVCTRGDYVQIQQDVMKVGGTPARVKSVSGNQIVIDDAIEAGPFSYGYVFRSSDGNIYQNTLTIVSDDTFDLDGPTMPEAGDLIVIGEVDYIVFDCLVKSISPNSDMSAELTLIELAPGIYASESSDVFPEYTPQISQTVNAEFAPPAEVEDLVIADNFWYCLGAGYAYYIDLDWDAPKGSAYEAFEIYCDTGRGYNLASVSKESIYRYIVSPIDLGKVHNFKVVATSSNGKKLDLGSVGSVSATPLLKVTPPSNVDRLFSDITGEVIQLFWDKIADCDCEKYLIRYSPDLDASWENSIPFMQVSSGTSLIASQARTGSYYIKAVDYNGNESTTAAEVITTIPNLFGLNIVDQLSDFPTLDGSKDRTTLWSPGNLILQQSVFGDQFTTEFHPEGYYYYRTILDLGQVFTVRIQSRIKAAGFNLVDLMVYWPNLNLLPAMSTIGSSDWDVETQYRAADSYNSIAAWDPMSDVSVMAAGDDDLFTPWRKFTIGDATGRIFQFRLKLISNKLSVTPRVYAGDILADMPDRQESINNVTSGTGVYSVMYDVPFYGPGSSPNIQISIDGASSGDYWTISNKTLAGFDIQFFDKNNVAVSRQFDALVRGYGGKSTVSL